MVPYEGVSIKENYLLFERAVAVMKKKLKLIFKRFTDLSFWQ